MRVLQAGAFEAIKTDFPQEAPCPGPATAVHIVEGRENVHTGPSQMGLLPVMAVPGHDPGIIPAIHVVLQA
jgi:hypothetical protein